MKRYEDMRHETAVLYHELSSERREDANEQPIATLADMIGWKYELALLTMEKGSKAGEAWSKFLEVVGAEKQGSEIANGYEHTTYRLQKQDKLLELEVRRNLGDGCAKITHKFTTIGSARPPSLRLLDIEERGYG